MQDEGRSLQLFTDRHEFTRLFAEYLNDDPPRNTILYFHGSGGNGKTWLLEFLRANCCKRFTPEKWQSIKSMPDTKVAEVAKHIQTATEKDCELLPAALIDFGQRPIGKEQPQCPFYGLLMLRRKLAAAAKELNYNLRFPLYDFACFCYLHSIGESGEEIKKLFAAETANLITAVVDMLAIFPGVGNVGSFGKTLLELRDKHFPVQQVAKLLKLTEAQVEKIRSKDPESIINELPRLFAEDLKLIMQTLNAPKRIVLFFDTHELFWGQQHNHLNGEPYWARDEWLRRLLTALLELKAGIVVVISGQEEPRWSEAIKFPISKESLDSQLVWHLSETDAKVYLQRAGIEDVALCKAVITYASVMKDQVHPFYLGLSADVVLTGKNITAEDFDTVPSDDRKVRELREKLLRNADEEVVYGVQALSACRAFNEELYMELGKALNFHATRPNFNKLIRFSFIWKDNRWGNNSYRIHNLLRRLENEIDNELTRRAHEWLEQYYQIIGDVGGEIYHAIHLDSNRGMKKFLELLSEENESNNFKLSHNFKLSQAFLEAVQIDFDQEPKKVKLFFERDFLNEHIS